MAEIKGRSLYYSNPNAPLGSVNMIKLPEFLDPSLLWFWCGSAYKDGEFSGTIAHKYLKSRFGGISMGPEMPCDVYSQDDHLLAVRALLAKMGLFNISDEDLAAYWISQLISEKFMKKELLDNPEVMDYISSVKKE